MSGDQNPYIVLGLSNNASKDDIKAAFRKLAMVYHPDRYASSPVIPTNPPSPLSLSPQCSPIPLPSSLTHTHTHIRHANAAPHIQASNETAYKSINNAYQMLLDPSFRYRQAYSPGKAGFQRSPNYSGTYYNNNGSYYYNNTNSAGFGYRRRSWKPPTTASLWREFKSSGSMAATAALGGLACSLLLLADPFTSSLWEQRNQGKLFKDVADEVALRRQALRDRELYMSRIENDSKNDNNDVCDSNATEWHRN
jgi:curved DNA-binding protein CbpA